MVLKRTFEKLDLIIIDACLSYQELTWFTFVSNASKFKKILSGALCVVSRCLIYKVHALARRSRGQLIYIITSCFVCQHLFFSFFFANRSLQRSDPSCCRSKRTCLLYCAVLDLSSTKSNPPLPRVGRRLLCTAIPGNRVAGSGYSEGAGAGADGHISRGRSICGKSKDNRRFFLTGHGEYDADTLANEYWRDKKTGAGH